MTNARRQMIGTLPMHFEKNAIWDEPGLRITTENNVLHVEALNPQRSIRSVTTRWQRVRIGWWLIWRAIWNR